MNKKIKKTKKKTEGLEKSYLWLNSEFNDCFKEFNKKSYKKNVRESLFITKKQSLNSEFRLSLTFLALYQFLKSNR